MTTILSGLALTLLALTGSTAFAAPLQCDLSGFLPNAAATTDGCCAFESKQSFYMNASYQITETDTPSDGTPSSSNTYTVETYLTLQSPDPGASKLYIMETDYSSFGFRHVQRVTKLFRPDLKKVFVLYEQSGVRTRCSVTADPTDLAREFGCFGPATQPSEFFRWQQKTTNGALQYQAPGNATDLDCNKYWVQVHTDSQSAGTCTPLEAASIATDATRIGTHEKKTTIKYQIERDPPLLPSAFATPVACNQENLVEFDDTTKSKIASILRLAKY